MRLTDEQYRILSKYEEQFRTAIKSRWARFPGTAAMHVIHNIKTQVTGHASRLNTSCSSCVLRLLTEMGNIYFADKAEREEQRTVSVMEKQMPVLEKVEVKTDRPKRGRKPKTE